MDTGAGGYPQRHRQRIREEGATRGEENQRRLRQGPPRERRRHKAQGSEVHPLSSQSREQGQAPQVGVLPGTPALHDHARGEGEERERRVPQEGTLHREGEPATVLLRDNGAQL